MSSKEPKTSIRPKPFFFAMPRVIRDRFDTFNETSLSTLSSKKLTYEAEDAEEEGMEIDGVVRERNAEVASASAKKTEEKNSTKPSTELAHKLLPESSAGFMKNVMEFRLKSNQQKSKALEQSSSLKSRLLKLFSLNSIMERISGPEVVPEIQMDFGRKIVVVGLHGWFPNRLIQRVIGNPSKTSDRIVDMFEAAIREADPNPPLIDGPAPIYKFPLRGDGCIEERVVKHFQELQRVPDAYAPEGLTSLQHFSEANSVLIGAHSQGAPVAVILLAKLLDEGILDPTKQRITLFTVAGIFHGPLPPLKKNLVVQYVEADAARQLFDLNDPNSPVSNLFYKALARILEAGINITVVSNWLDQVVPFYSACLLGVDHPNIWRAIHINSEHYRSDFLTSVVELGLKIKNTQPALGEPETHMILAHVSDYLAGSIYQHATHSGGYKHMASYKSALEWMFAGPGSKGSSMELIDHVRNRPLQPTVNPYYLPWLFRGWFRNPALLSNPLIMDDFTTLPEKYRQWQPESKSLKEFKFKLEPLNLVSKF